jgi:RNA polymerase sigma-70 factor (ECF subfamily)
VFQITRNAIADYYRQLKLEPPEPALTTGFVESRNENALNPEVAGWLEPMLESLPEKYRQALRLTELEGMKQRELARELGLSLSAVKMRVRRGQGEIEGRAPGLLPFRAGPARKYPRISQQIRQ